MVVGHGRGAPMGRVPRMPHDAWLDPLGPPLCPSQARTSRPCLLRLPSLRGRIRWPGFLPSSRVAPFGGRFVLGSIPLRRRRAPVGHPGLSVFGFGHGELLLALVAARLLGRSPCLETAPWMGLRAGLDDASGPGGAALNFWPDPSGTWWSVGGILTLSHEGGAHDLPSLMAALKSLFTTLPFFLPGLVGLSWAAVREKGPWPWLLFCLLCAILEPIRQRGAFGVGIPYPFMLAAPLASLGTALLLDAAIKLGPWRGGLSAAATLCLFLWPVDFSWLRSISLAPKPVDELTAYLDKNARPGDLVCGMPQFNWRLRPLLRDCDPLDMVAYQGKGNGIYPPGAAATRFAYPCGLENVRYAIVCRIHLMGVFRLNGVALTFLEMERAGWRQVFDDKTFKVYENPLFGAKPDPTVCILQVPEYYRRAGAQAVSDGRRDLALFAQERLQSSTMGLRR